MSDKNFNHIAALTAKIKADVGEKRPAERMDNAEFEAAVTAAYEKTMQINGRVPERDNSRQSIIVNSRKFNPVPLSELKMAHLNPSQKARFENAIKAAKRWQNLAANTPALSFVISGNAGVGKTAIATAIARHTAVLIKQQDREFFDRTGSFRQRRSDWKYIEASDLMTAVSGGNLDGHGRSIPFKKSLARYATLVLNNVGSEEVPYTNAATVDGKRQRLYLQFLDWAWESGRHVIVTTTRPLMTEKDGRVGVHDGFKYIFGDEAYSRLFQMASGGYMVDLTDLPDYRKIANKEGAK